MSVWKKLVEMMEGPRDYNPGWRTNSIWDRADDASRTAAAQPPSPGKPQGPRPPATGPIVWRGDQMKDTDLFRAKSDKKTGNQTEEGLIPALKAAGGTISRAPDGSGIAVCPSGYAVDPGVWKDWSPTRSKAEINATTDTVKGASKIGVGPGANNSFDVLIQAHVSDNKGKQSILVTKVVWASLDRSSVQAQTPEARQAKLEILMDTDDPSELAQLFPAQPKQNTLGKPPKPVDMGQNPLASPTKVQWTKGNAPSSVARDSSWNDIDLSRVKPKK